MNMKSCDTNGKIILSIITVCYNSVKTIVDTLDSVRDQSRLSFEYIVIDGESTDGTLEILKDNADIISLLLSEPDAGIYDAMNKGFQRSTGRFILYLNSDDYLDKHGVQNIIATANDLSYQGNCIITGVTRIVDSLKAEKGLLKFSDLRYADRFKYNPFPHPSTVVSKSIIKKCDGFKNEYSIASDYDFFLRASSLNPSIVIMNIVISNMREGGASDENSKIKVLIRHQAELYLIQSQFIPSYLAAYFLLLRLAKLTVKKFVLRSRNLFKRLNDH